MASPSVTPTPPESLLELHNIYITAVEAALNDVPLPVKAAVEKFKAYLSGDKRVSSIDYNTMRLLPSRKSHTHKEQMLAIAHFLYPDFSLQKAVIHYEWARRHAKSEALNRQKAEVEAALTRRGGDKVQEIQGPWGGQEQDPVSLDGPDALPMPVEIGSEDNFKDFFSFLHLNKDPKDFLMGNGSNGKRQFNLHPGKELIWETPMVEFERGVVYVDGRLDLCKMVIGPTHIEKLMDSLDANTFVRHFLLGNNTIPATGAKRIARFIDSHPNQMETWYLAGNNIRHAGFQLLAEAMSKSPSLTNLWLKRNPLTPASALDLARIILHAPALRTLDLENTELGDAGCTDLFNQLRGQPFALKHILLNANGLGERAAASIAATLEAGWQPESLMLNSNPIGDSGLTHLCRAIKSNVSLKRINFQSLGLTDKGANELGAALAQHPQIACVTLGASVTTAVHGQRYNVFGDEALPGLKLLLANPAMRLLALGNTALSEAGMEELRSAVETSELCYFEARRVGAPNSSLAVRNRLEENVRKYFGTDLKSFGKSLELRLLRNCEDVRLIDSVYRTRTQQKGSIKQFWDEGDPTWALVEADWDN